MHLQCMLTVSCCVLCLPAAALQASAGAGTDAAVFSGAAEEPAAGGSRSSVLDHQGVHMPVATVAVCVSGQQGRSPYRAAGQGQQAALLCIAAAESAG